MIDSQKITPLIFLLALASLFALNLVRANETSAKGPPAPPPPSQFAPVSDLKGQVDHYLKRTSEVLANEESFDDAGKARLKKDANTLAAIGLVLALHDDKSDVQSASGDFIKAAQALAKAQDYAAANKAFEDLKKAAKGNGASQEPPKDWQKVADLGSLMKQVPVINTALKRGVSSAARLAKTKDESAGQAAALAAIAQASMADTHEVKNPADLTKWYQYCAEMRDAAGQVNAAIRAGDHAKTTSAMSRLANSCETCHKVFRKETH